MVAHAKTKKHLASQAKAQPCQKQPELVRPAASAVDCDLVDIVKGDGSVLGELSEIKQLLHVVLSGLAELLDDCSDSEDEAK